MSFVLACSQPESAPLPDTLSVASGNAPSEPDTGSTFAPIYTYYLDNVSVPEDAFSLGDSTLRFVAVVDSPAIEVRAYTSDELYHQYGEDHDIGLREIDDHAAHLYQKALEMGAIAHVDSTGEMMQEYLEYEEQYWGTGKTQALFAELEDACIGSNGDDRLVYLSIPWMSSFKNKTSSFIHYSGFATIALYDRPWYNDHMMTWYLKVGWLHVPLCIHPFTPIDNRTESTIFL